MTESSSSSNDGRWLRTIELKMSYEQKQKNVTTSSCRVFHNGRMSSKKCPIRRIFH